MSEPPGLLVGLLPLPPPPTRSTLSLPLAKKNPPPLSDNVPGGAEGHRDHIRMGIMTQLKPSPLCGSNRAGDNGSWTCIETSDSSTTPKKSRRYLALNPTVGSPPPSSI